MALENLSSTTEHISIKSSKPFFKASSAVVLSVVWILKWRTDSEGWGIEYPQKSTSGLRRIVWRRAFPKVWSSSSILKAADVAVEEGSREIFILLSLRRRKGMKSCEKLPILSLFVQNIGNPIPQEKCFSV